jgi:hypothetical protein
LINLLLCLCRLACQLDKALTNVGALLSNQVEGRVCTEIDPRLAKDKGGFQHFPALLTVLCDSCSAWDSVRSVLHVAKTSKMTSAVYHASPGCL